MIWVGPELESGAVIEAFEGRAPEVRRVGSVGVLLKEPAIRDRLEEVGLLDLAKRLPEDVKAEALAWETYCRLRKDEVVVGLFDAATGKVLMVDGKEIFYIRRRIS